MLVEKHDIRIHHSTNMLTLEQARFWYSGNDLVHGFDHIARVYRLVERLALAEGADLEIVQAAALLHDAHSMGTQDDSTAGGQTTLSSKGTLEAVQTASDDPAQDLGRRVEHHERSAELAAQVLGEAGWENDRIAAVQHCIRAHRFRDETNRPESLEAKVLFDADKLDAIGAVGAARAIAYATLAGQPFYAPPSELFMQNGRLEDGEPHSAYHEYLFKLIKIKARLFTPSAQRMAEKRQRRMKTFFEGLVQEIERS